MISGRFMFKNVGEASVYLVERFLVDYKVVAKVWVAVRGDESSEWSKLCPLPLTDFSRVMHMRS
jgi:hypothetical protein